MKTILAAVGVGLLMAMPAWADLVQPAAPSAGASVRISEATQSAGSASALSLADANTNTRANFVYYCALNGGGTDITGGSGGNGGTDNSNNGGTDTGGGAGGSANGGGETNNSNGGQVPAPAASVLALVGMACVSWLKRRV